MIATKLTALLLPFSLLKPSIETIERLINLKISSNEIDRPWKFKGITVDWVSICSSKSHAINVTLTTHHDSTVICVTCNTGVFPESRLLLDCIVQELNIEEKNNSPDDSSK